MSPPYSFVFHSWKILPSGDYMVASGWSDLGKAPEWFVFPAGYCKVIAGLDGLPLLQVFPPGAEGPDMDNGVPY